MKRFSWPEMVRYWESHASRRVSLDPVADPDGLGNVCHAGAPLWLNRHYARGQRFVFKKLLADVPTMDDSERALDVGCGTARWSAILAAHGYSTVGIDLQPSLVAANSKRYPWISFFCAPIQDFDSPERFHLISSVTVLQHIPHDEQPIAVRKMAKLLHPGGHMIVLENISDQAPHVFANKPAVWIQRFEAAGLQCIYSFRYDYNPALRLVTALAGFAHTIRGGRREGAITGPETYATVLTDVAARTRIANAVKRLAVQIDCIIDPMLVRSQAPFPAGHVGFLFTNGSAVHQL